MVPRLFRWAFNTNRTVTSLTYGIVDDINMYPCTYEQLVCLAFINDLFAVFVLSF